MSRLQAVPSGLAALLAARSDEPVLDGGRCPVSLFVDTSSLAFMIMALAQAARFRRPWSVWADGLVAVVGAMH